MQAVIAKALWALPIASVIIVGAQAWLKYKNYQSSVLKISPLTRLGGRMTSANIVFDDHPNETRFADQIEPITVDSIFNRMVGANLAAAPLMLSL